MAASCTRSCLRSKFNPFYHFPYTNLRCLHSYRIRTSLSLRHSSTTSPGGDESHAQSTFEKMVKDRRRRTENSVLVHVYSKFVANSLYSYCQKYGNIKRTSQYTLGNDKDFVLVEFENEEGANNLLREANHFDHQNVVPVHSRCLWYRETHDDKDIDWSPMQNAGIHTEVVPNEKQLVRQLQQAKSVSDQMLVHYENLRLSDLGHQLRFFVCRQLESGFKGMFSNCVVLPFGSTVNGFGKLDCDLDMVMSFGDLQNKADTSQLFFHTKRSLANGRVQMQRYLEIFGDVVSNFFPGCCNVQRILHARVPIIKFQQELVNVECDLSMNSLSGVYMSELLYLYGEMDERVRPLVFTVLKWARQSSLTHENPGRWITNFSLILMVVFFLQNRPEPVLPSLGTLQTLAGSSDTRYSDDIDCTFLRDLGKFPTMRNIEELDDLLIEFYTFYANFNFKTRGFSLISGKDVDKSDSSPLYIQNPLETDLNVSKNVSGDEVARLSDQIRTALWNLETLNTKNDDSKLWGLLKLFNVQLNGNNGQLNKKRFPVSVYFDGTSRDAARDVSRETTVNKEASLSMLNALPNGNMTKIMASKDLVGKLGLERLIGTKLKKSNKKGSTSSKLRRPIKRAPWTF